MTIRRGWAGAAVVLAVLGGSPAFAQDQQQPRKPAAAKARAKAGTVKPKAPPPKADGDATEAAPSVETEAEAEVEVGAETEAAPTETEAAPEAPAAEPAGDAVDPEPEADAEPVRKQRPARKHRPRYRPYYAPSPDAPPPMPHEMEYVDGADVPDGYTKVERIRTGLVIAGAVTFGVGWLSAAAAAAAMSGSENECVYYTQGEEESYADFCEDGPDEEEIAPLYIPIVGPFIAMGTLEHEDGAARAALLVNGVVQVGGAAMLIAGITATKTVLVRTKYAKVSVSPGPGSVHLNGSF